MENGIQEHLDNLSAKSKEVQGQSYRHLLGKTNEKVDWGAQVWDNILELLNSQDNRARSIAGQLLANLAKSEPERIKDDFPKLIHATRDERFVTARHILQSLWKVGVVNQELQKLTVKGLSGRYVDCANEKAARIIRHDIIELLKKMYDKSEDNSLKEKALELIEVEQDEKNRKKYLKLWKGSRA